MFHRIIISILLLFAFQAILMANDSTIEKINSNNDHGLWLEENLIKRLNADWTIRLRFEQRFAADYRILYAREHELYVHYDAAKLLSHHLRSIVTNVVIGVGDNFTKILQKNTLGEFHWAWYMKSIFEVLLISPLWDWTIKQRMRGEYYDYRTKHYKSYGAGRYRLEIFSPWKWTCWNINPFVFNEWFFRHNSYHKNHPTGLVGGWYENRFRTGVVLDLWKHLSAAFYWQWVAKKQIPGTHPRWFNNYYLGCTIDLSF